MWLTSSSIGRKFVMAVTGIALVLFVTFHCLMNTVAIVWPTAYNVICEFLGANWYALIASAGLAVLIIIHIIYASVLTIENRKARGNDRYLVTSRPPQVEWSSKNMYVLGVVVLAFLVVHLIQFWARMQWQEIIGHEYTVNGVTYAPQFGTLFLQAAFAEVWTPIVYIIGFVALWFHMNHGFWSMFHSVGWDNNHWINRLKCIGGWWVSIVIALFIAQAIVFTVKAHNQDFINDPKLQQQYVSYYDEVSDAMLNDFSSQAAAAGLNRRPTSQMEAMQMQVAAEELYKRLAPGFVEKANEIAAAKAALFPQAASSKIMQALDLAENLAEYADEEPAQVVPAAEVVEETVEVQQTEELN